MLYEEWCLPDEICSSDSCLHGCGGIWLGKYFHVSFPAKFKDRNFHITILEMFAVVIMRGSRKFFQRGSNFFFFLVD